jgi:hypothetical protein
MRKEKTADSSFFWHFSPSTSVHRKNAIAVDVFSEKGLEFSKHPKRISQSASALRCLAPGETCVWGPSWYVRVVGTTKDVLETGGRGLVGF